MTIPKIFIVEDDLLNVKLLKAMLNRIGYAFSGTASQGPAALKAVTEEVPDIILMDIKIEGPWDGIETVGKIRKATKVPIIFITAYSDKEIMNRALEVSPYGFLIKPVSELGLNAAIEVALAKSRGDREIQRLSRILTESLNEILIFNTNTLRFTYVNDAAVHASGWSRQELLEKSPLDLQNNLSEKQYRKIIQPLLSGEKDTLHFEINQICKNGKKYPVEINLHKDPDNSNSIIVFGHDISERKARERSQIRRHRRQTVANQIAQLGVNRVPLGDICKYIQEELIKLYHVSSFYLALIDQQDNLFYFPFWRDEKGAAAPAPISVHDSRSLLARVVARGKTLHIQRAEIEAADQNNKALVIGDLPQSWVGIPLLLEEHVLGVIVIQSYDAEDIFTPKRIEFFELIASQLALVIFADKLERNLKKSEAQSRLILETTHDAIIQLDEKGQVIYANPACETIFGFSIKEFYSEPLAKLIVPEYYRDDHVNGLLNFQKNGTGTAIGKTIQIEARHKSSKPIFVDLTISPVRSEDGWQAIAVIRDITQRKEMEKLATKLGAAFTQSADAAAITHRDGEINYINPAFESIMDHKLRDIKGQDLLDVMLGVNNSTIKQEIKEYLTRGANWEGRCSFIREDGSTFQANASFSPVENDLGAVVSHILVFRDISKEVELELQLHQSQKLQSIGQLAAGIAHEINTPTQYVSDNLFFIKDAHQGLQRLFNAYQELKLGQDDSLVKPVTALETEIDISFLMEEVPQAIEQAMEGVGRISEIVKAIKEFSHPGEEQMRLTDINRAIRTTVTVARNEWKYVAEIELNLAEDLPEILCYPGEINQVILNIIVNAAHAIAETGAEKHGTKGKIEIHTRMVPDYLEIAISDNGPGIPEDIQGKVYDPFFTTKEVGRGTGQGLSLAHMSITEKHHGELVFETETGQGTTFFIRLPLEQQMVE